jgi:endonuclease YncB( thermonuclease family)
MGALMTTFLIVVGLGIVFAVLLLRNGGRSRTPPPQRRVPQPSVIRPVVHATPAAAHRPTIVQGHCHVVDGDTITIRGMSIRLSGIDAPEMDHPYGRNAKWALVSLCKGQVIRAEIVGLDHYGRHVARCHMQDGRDIAAEMVRTGYAVDWPKYSGGRYRHLEVAGVRQRLWRCDARQKGRFPRAG